MARRLDHRPWTAKDNNRLTELIKVGWEYKLIGHELGRTAAAVKNQRLELGLSRRRDGIRKHSLRFNVNDIEYWELRGRAKLRHMSLSNYIRSVLLKGLH